MKKEEFTSSLLEEVEKRGWEHPVVFLEPLWRSQRNKMEGVYLPEGLPIFVGEKNLRPYMHIGDDLWGYEISPAPDHIRIRVNVGGGDEITELAGIREGVVMSGLINPDFIPTLLDYREGKELVSFPEGKLPYPLNDWERQYRFRHFLEALGSSSVPHNCYNGGHWPGVRAMLKSGLKTSP